jgi:opacity protein-like surface antigen
MINPGLKIGAKLAFCEPSNTSILPFQLIASVEPDSIEEPCPRRIAAETQKSNLRMRKSALLCLLVPVFSFAQESSRLHLTLFGGVSNYQGDLQGRTFTFNQSNLAIGAGLKYDLTPHIGVRAGIQYGTVEAHDNQNTEAVLRARNLSFESRILEGNLLLEYTLFNMEDKKISPYVFGGIALYHFNPYAFDTLGNKVFLKPLSTEGQGLTAYPERKEYKLTQFAIPFGGGIKFRVSPNVVLGYEIGLRKLFTDHLDDVSGTYVDEFRLFEERGAKAVEMAYRGNQLKDGLPYPEEGSPRGGAKYKDWYYFQGLTLTIGIGGSGGGFGGGRGSIGCPKNVY